MKTKHLAESAEFKTHTRRRFAGTFWRRDWTARAKLPLLLLTAALVLAGTSARASDPIGVFAKIDKVVLEPGDAAPERIQLWGAFCLADQKDRDSYLPPAKGYLYCKLPAEKQEAARKEWNDLKATAGTGKVIGFGSRYMPQPKVRSAEEKPANPDVYPVAYGLVKSDRRGESYPPIKALMSDAPKKLSDTKDGAPVPSSKATQQKDAGPNGDSSQLAGRSQ